MHYSQVTQSKTGDQGIYLREPFQLERPNRLGVSVDAKFHEDAGMLTYCSITETHVKYCHLLHMLTTDSHNCYARGLGGYVLYNKS